MMQKSFAIHTLGCKVNTYESDAMAEALRDGKLGVMDYYQMQNTIADTEMRTGIAKAAVPSTDAPKPLDGKK